MSSPGTTMRAAVLGADGPVIVERKLARPGPTEILVRVRAASLNRADLLLIDGKAHGLQGGPGTPLGLEWAGEVIEAGADVADVSGLKVGDRVMCSGTGGFADYAVTDARRAFAIPSAAMSYETAACLTVALRTAHVALVTHGALRMGRSVLVLGASSGVGLMCLQVARLLGAGTVVGTSTRADRRERLREFGAGETVDTGDAGWPDAVLALTGGRGVDLVIDFLAGPHLGPAMRATALGGRIVNVGRMAGERGEFDFDLHSMRRIQYLGTSFRTRDAAEVGAIGAQVRADLWPALQAGLLGLPIDMRLPLEAVAQACDAMRRNVHFGKIVLSTDQ
ncbi:quinone oxidoreductase family protein [Xylophilus sp. GOD-11R]|uniref:quinone oxidoreductase family protein n=1 Tax=Xylophilus sp. GOD-11R TaxID=3089814 RepID=UPI00298CD839|nr:zinc-binding dehydrogenase [Xylophilus sp. GOD-11R]WPB56070.1 zinc-binding dehydrogenase [Xylophilus sp. GOD-11R]